MRPRLLIIVQFTLSMWWLLVSLAGSLTFAKRGHPSEYTIIYPMNDISAKNASGFLQEYIFRLTNVNLSCQPDSSFSGECPEFSILVGNTTFSLSLISELKINDTDSFHLETVNKRFIIYGGCRGAHYGVMEILERYGKVRWYAYDQTVIPELDDFSVDITLEEQTPDFPFRAVWWPAVNEGNLPYFFRLNHDHKIASEQGGAVQWGGDLFVHTFFKLIPPSKYFNEHPEWFSLINNRRINTGQLCISNDKLRQQLLNNLLEIIKKDKRVPGSVYSVSQNDNGDCCQCEECRKIKEKYGNQESGIMLWFVNQIAEVVEEKYPDEEIYIDTLAFWYTQHAPKNISPRKNVIPRLCPINNDMSRPFNVSNIQQNVEFRQDLIDWTNLSSKLMIWDYTGSFQQMIAVYPNIYSIPSNIQLYKNMHVMSMYSQGSGVHSEFAELKTWTISKMLWNSSRDYTSLANEFIEAYYGKASDIVKKYLKETHETVLEEERRLHCEMIVTDFDWFDKNLAKWVGYWEDAAKAVKDDQLREYHVYKTGASVLFTRFNRIYDERNGIKFAWTNNDHVKPVSVPEESLKIATDLLHRVYSPRRIMLCEMDDCHHCELLKIDKYVNGFNITKIRSNKYEAGVAVDMTGRLGYLIDNNDQWNYIDGNYGGLDFDSRYGNIDDVPDIYYDLVSHSTENITVKKHIKNGAVDLHIKRIYRVTDFGLNVSISYQADDWENTYFRCVSSFAIRIGDASNVASKLDEGRWNLINISKGRNKEFFSYSGVDLLGKKSIMIGSPKSRRCVTIYFPQIEFERIFVTVYPNDNAVRVFFTQEPRYLSPTEQDNRGNWIIVPTQDEISLPDYVSPKDDDFDSYEYDAESCLINQKAAKFVTDESSDLNSAAHFFCNTTEYGLNHTIEFSNDKEYHLLVHAKIETKDIEGNVIKAIIKCNDTIIEKFLDNKNITNHSYSWYDLGGLKILPLCHVAFASQNASNELRIDRFKFSIQSNQEDENKRTTLIIGLCGTFIPIFVIVVLAIIMWQCNKRKEARKDVIQLSTQKLISDN